MAAHLISLSLVVPGATGEFSRVNLRSDTVRYQQGHRGLTGPDESLATSDVASIDGTDVLDLDDRAGLRLESMPVAVPVAIHGVDGADAWRILTGLRDVLNVRRYGPAQLEAALADGSTWAVTFVPEAAAGDVPADRINAKDQRFTIRGLAADPFAYGPTVSFEYGVATGGGEFPIEFDWELAAGSIIGAATAVEVAGTDFAFPVITVEGPTPSVTASRGDQSWTITQPLLAGETVKVRHSPRRVRGVPRVEGPDGSSWFRHLASGWRLWPLRPGSESITVSAAGATSDTRIWVEFRPAKRSLL